MISSSIDPQPIVSGNSAQVNITLFVNGFSLPVAQLGPNYLFLRSPINHPPIEAEILLDVDGDKEQWRVFLPKGISEKQKRVETSAAT